ncbi:hypothetical protein P3875_10420 [Myroides sp. JBRI-B21084]|uniref:hypothetical protein n=1 Tax=Myroides sp. JBRI-B21084 TaxID=3119977 RepID=UPI0026E1E679|nr:hypothetical protein [Paenimyroides cloacae]WKW46187.1 hypothetical protein P3875_10420 [Paenimyroides cloacae]
MKKLVAVTLLIFGFAVTSCTDDDAQQPTPASGTYLPSKIYGDDGEITFKYDDKNRLIEVKESEGDYTFTKTFTYTGEQLTAAKFSEVSQQEVFDYLYTFTYQSNKVISSYYDSRFPETVYTDEVVIDAKGNVVFLWDNNYFTNAAGNISKISNSLEETLFEYDSKNGIFKNVKTPQWALVYLTDDFSLNIANNCIKEDYTYFETNENEVFNRVYEYNADQYPVKISFPSEDYDLVVEYIKK